jgi:hypothetical protein
MARTAPRTASSLFLSLPPLVPASSATPTPPGAPMSEEAPVLYEGSDEFLNPCRCFCAISVFRRLSCKHACSRRQQIDHHYARLAQTAPGLGNSSPLGDISTQATSLRQREVGRPKTFLDKMPRDIALAFHAVAAQLSSDDKRSSRQRNSISLAKHRWDPQLHVL